MHKPKLWLRLAALGLAAVLVLADQLMKAWATNNLPGQGRQTVIPGVLGLRYAQNTGISFGLLGDSPGVMTAVTVITGLVMAAAIVLILWGKLDTHGQLGSAAVVLGGGIGNFIDRAVQGYVVDYFEFLFMRFAIFNLADVFITMGIIWLTIAILRGESRKKREAQAEI